MQGAKKFLEDHPELLRYAKLDAKWEALVGQFDYDVREAIDRLFAATSEWPAIEGDEQTES